MRINASCTSTAVRDARIALFADLFRIDTESAAALYRHADSLDTLAFLTDSDRHPDDKRKTDRAKAYRLAAFGIDHGLLSQAIRDIFRRV